MDETERRARWAHDQAVSQLQKCMPDDKAAEAAYGVAYQRLVKLGVAPQLRRKYRGR